MKQDISETPGRFERLGRVRPTALHEPRLEAHWAVQVAAAAADATLERRDDDSQSALTWDATRRALVTEPLPGGVRAGFRIRDLTLLVEDDSEIRSASTPSGGDAGVGGRLAAMSLEGHSLEEGLDWMQGHVRSRSLASATLALRDYEMPAHPVREEGAPFREPADSLAELERWFAGAAGVLESVAARERGASPVRLWPHHFDLATLVELDAGASVETARSIGVGLSPGDSSYDEPYLYVNPWPRPEAPMGGLPDLPGGARWHTDGWLGAVLPGSALDAAARAEEQERTLREWIDAAIAAARELLDERKERDG